MLQTDLIMLVLRRRRRHDEADAFASLVERLIDHHGPANEADDATQTEYERGPIVSPFFHSPRMAYRMAFLGGPVPEAGPALQGLQVV